MTVTFKFSKISSWAHKNFEIYEIWKDFYGFSNQKSSQETAVYPLCCGERARMPSEIWMVLECFHQSKLLINKFQKTVVFIHIDGCFDLKFWIFCFVGVAEWGYNEEQSKKLWELSEKLSKVKFPTELWFFEEKTISYSLVVCHWSVNAVQL